MGLRFGVEGLEKPKIRGTLKGSLKGSIRVL